MPKRKRVQFQEDEMTDEEALKFSKRKREEEGGGESSGDLADWADTNTREDGEGQEGGKHTLDSDEEEEDKYDKLDIDQIEGQEEATEDYEGETKITPFNMKDEMEEGEFDSTGSFVFKKKSEDIKDAWLDNIDWGKVKKDAGDLWKEAEEEEDEEEGKGGEGGGGEEDTRKRVAVFSEMLEIMEPTETVTKTLKRLGGPRDIIQERKQRWKDKKEGNVSTTQEEEKSANKKAVMVFTGLVDQLVSDGDMEVYGYTYEKIRFEKDKRDKLTAQKKSKQKLVGKDDDDDLDMFAAEIDETSKETPTTSIKESQAEQGGSEGENVDLMASLSDEVMWEFKWENTEESQMHGPWSSAQMQSWVDQGYFQQKEAWVRRVGQKGAQFYTTQRIDFDLYI